MQNISIQVHILAAYHTYTENVQQHRPMPSLLLSKDVLGKFIDCYVCVCVCVFEDAERKTWSISRG